MNNVTFLSNMVYFTQYNKKWACRGWADLSSPPNSHAFVSIVIVAGTVCQMERLHFPVSLADWIGQWHERGSYWMVIFKEHPWKKSTLLLSAFVFAAPKGTWWVGGSCVLSMWSRQMAGVWILYDWNSYTSPEWLSSRHFYVRKKVFLG